MLKKFYCIILSIILILSLYLPVYAASATASLDANTSSLKVGDTFTVTLSLKCSEGINGITGLKYNYDSNILELVNSKIKDSNYIDMGTDNTLDLICNSVDTITSSEIYEFTFKVKSDAKADSKAEISISSFTFDSDEATNSEVTMDARKVEVSVGKDGVVSIKSNIQVNPNDNSSNNNGFPFVIVIIAIVVVIGGIFVVANGKNKKSKKSSKSRHTK